MLVLKFTTITVKWRMSETTHTSSPIEKNVDAVLYNALAKCKYLYLQLLLQSVKLHLQNIEKSQKINFQTSNIISFQTMPENRFHPSFKPIMTQ